MRGGAGGGGGEGIDGRGEDWWGIACRCPNMRRSRVSDFKISDDNLLAFWYAYSMANETPGNLHPLLVAGAAHIGFSPACLRLTLALPLRLPISTALLDSLAALYTQHATLGICSFTAYLYGYAEDALALLRTTSLNAIGHWLHLTSFKSKNM